MKLLILHGGTGSRLRPLTNFIPKGFIRLSGRSSVERILDSSQAFVAAQTIVAPRGDELVLVERQLSKLDGKPLEVMLAEESPMRSIVEFIKIANDSVMIWWGDTVASLDVEDFITRHTASSAQASMALWETDSLRELKHWGSVSLDTQFMTYDHPVPFIGKQGLVKAGIFIFEPSIFEDIYRLSQRKMDMSYVINQLLYEKRFYGIPFDGYKVNLNYGYDLIKAVSMVNKYYNCEEGYIAESVILGEYVDLIGSGVSVDNEVKLGQGTVIEDSIIMEGAVIGSNATIVDSIIAPGVRVEPGTFVNKKIVTRDQLAPMRESPY